jgi:hypothetical protein
MRPCEAGEEKAFVFMFSCPASSKSILEAEGRSSSHALA